MFDEASDAVEQNLVSHPAPPLLLPLHCIMLSTSVPAVSVSSELWSSDEERCRSANDLVVLPRPLPRFLDDDFDGFLPKQQQLHEDLFERDELDLPSMDDFVDFDAGLDRIFM